MSSLGYGYLGDLMAKCVRAKGLFNIGGGVLNNIQLVFTYLVYITHKYIYPRLVGIPGLVYDLHTISIQASVVFQAE